MWVTTHMSHPNLSLVTLFSRVSLDSQCPTLDYPAGHSCIHWPFNSATPSSSLGFDLAGFVDSGYPKMDVQWLRHWVVFLNMTFLILLLFIEFKLWFPVVLSLGGGVAAFSLPSICLSLQLQETKILSSYKQAAETLKPKKSCFSQSS